MELKAIRWMDVYANKLLRNTYGIGSLTVFVIYIFKCDSHKVIAHVSVVCGIETKALENRKQKWRLVSTPHEEINQNFAKSLQNHTERQSSETGSDRCWPRQIDVRIQTGRPDEFVESYCSGELE